MTKYLLTKHDFKRYLLAELPDTRQEDLIFWKKTIPMPVDMVYGIFERRGALLGKYLDHIGAICLSGYIAEQSGLEWQEEIVKQPTKDNLVRIEEVRNGFREGLNRTNAGEMLGVMAELLMLGGYVPDENRLADAICHEGRKYKRLWLPVQFRSIIGEHFPEVLQYMSLSNWDMFSNVVADELKVYRMGFADAFTGIFNKLIEYIIQNSGSARGGYSTASGVSIVQEGSQNGYAAHSPVYGMVSDGSIWEPRYAGGGSTFILNSNHPFNELLKQKGSETEKAVFDLLGAFSEIESGTMSDTDRRVMENLRQDLSRKLRLKLEDQL